MIEWIIQAETIGNISDGYWYSNGEELVRYKDCKYRDTINCGMQFYGNDDDGHLCKSDDWTQDDGFCYLGERKDV